MADNQTRIEQIREILASGVKSVSADGASTTLDHDSLRAELRQLIAEDPAYQAGKKHRISTLDLGNCW
jgi:hypothetical protein